MFPSLPFLCFLVHPLFCFLFLTASVLSALLLLLSRCLGSAVGGIVPSISPWHWVPGLGSFLGLLSITVFFLWLLSGYKWSDFFQCCSSAIVQALLCASLFSNFFSEAVLLNKKNLVQAATCHMRSFCQERMCHSSSAKKKTKGEKKEKLLLVSFFCFVLLKISKYV